MFMFIPSFLCCDPRGVLGLDNLLCYLLEAMGVVPSDYRFQPVPLTRSDASLGAISTLSALTLANGKRRRELSPPAFPIHLSRGLSLACHTGGSRRAGQDEAESIRRARRQRFLESFLYQYVRKKRGP